MNRRAARARGLLGALLIGLPALLLGCQDLNTPVYFFDAALDMSLDGNPVNGNDPRAETKAALRFRNPTKQERQDLDKQSSALGFKVPWIQRSHVHIELAYQITNTDDKQGQFNVMVDGVNEFTQYDENVVAMALQQGNNDPPDYLPLLESRPQLLAAGATFNGTLREDDFEEAELDLEALGRWLAPDTFTGVLINDSQVNPVGLEMVPNNDVIPALIEVDVNFTASAAMTCTYMLRVRDDDDQLLHDAGDTLFTPTPALFQPPAMTMTDN